MSRSPAEEVRRLSDLLHQYQHEYYVENAPTVSDREYDRLFDELVRLERQYPELRRPDSPTHRVGSDLAHGLPEVAHTIPVLSLDKAYTHEELLAWIDKTVRAADRDLSFAVEEKIDGISIVLYYEDGVLRRAVTRGNGLVGNDVTPNVRTIRSVPLRLREPDTVAVRGEVYLPRDRFQEINEKLEVPFANPRNLAAGTIRRIKSSEVSGVPLQIFAYEGYFQPPRHTHLDALNRLAVLGFRCNPRTAFFFAAEAPKDNAVGLPTWEVGRMDGLAAYVARRTRERESLLYEIDGLVVKVNELTVREDLGYTGHHPRWALAFKFEAPQAVSTVQAIDVQVGRTGRVTPVARIKPVQIGGSTVSNVTLHNQDYVELLELAIGDVVAVSRRGDVIPAVERVVEKNQAGNTTWRMPEECPSCSTPLAHRGAHHFCTNPTCPAQQTGRLQFFVSRGQMDIDSVGPETLTVLMQQGMVQDVPDIYRADYDALLNLPGYGPKKVQIIKAGVAASKARPFRRVLVSLGIPELGPKVAELLIDAGYRSIHELFDVADRNDPGAFTAIPGIGEKTAATLIQELRNPQVRSVVNALQEAGLNFEEEGEGDSAGEVPPQSFAGQIWCVTGSFQRFKPRSKATDEIKRRGGKVTSSVTGATTHLLAGENAGSKLARAEELGTTVVSEAEFLEMLSS
jgi:DNA ligase (NAD+)